MGSKNFIDPIYQNMQDSAQQVHLSLGRPSSRATRQQSLQQLSMLKAAKEGQHVVMNRLFLSLLFMLFTICAPAQLLWKISGNGLSQPSYLFGSMHYAPTHFIDSIKGLRAVMEEVGQIYGEVVSSDTTVNNFIPDLSVLEMPDELELADLYTKEEQDRINHFILRFSMFDEDDFLWTNSDFTPSAALKEILQDLYFDNVKLIFDSIPMMTFDKNFEMFAINNGKPVGALDDAELHRTVISDSYLGSLELTKQAKGLLVFIDNYAIINSQLYSLLLDYHSQDLLRINNISSVKKRNKEYDKKKELSCQGRNITWVKKMTAIMADKSTLFVVGCAHLGNPIKEKRGVIQLLQKAGYTLEPISTSLKN